jgi:hypothetical protein
LSCERVNFFCSNYICTCRRIFHGVFCFFFIWINFGCWCLCNYFKSTYFCFNQSNHWIGLSKLVSTFFRNLIHLVSTTCLWSIACILTLLLLLSFKQFILLSPIFSRTLNT